MFDFLSFLQPVTKYLMDSFGLIGMLLAMAMPVLLLVLVFVALGVIVRLFQGAGILGAKSRLKKANALRRQGKYREAYDIYLQLYQKKGKEKLVSTYDIGMLCKEGEEDGWDMHEWESSSEYWFNKSLNPFNPATHYEYGLCLLKYAGKNPLKTAQGAKHIRLAAKLGCKSAQPLADEHRPKAAMALAKADFLTAASFGNADAQYAMSTMTSGNEAIAWLELAADEKHVQACEVLGQKYVRGEDVKENLSKAVTYLTVAAEHGRMNAQAYLGLIYNNKKYPRHDVDTAIKWYKLAAVQGHPYSMYNLAVIYANKMDEYAKQHNLTSKIDCASDSTYMGYFMEFNDWKEKAAEHGITPETAGKR